MSLKELLRPLGHVYRGTVTNQPMRELHAILKLRPEFSRLSDGELKLAAHHARAGAEVIPLFALTAEIVVRVLGLQMFDVQLLGALAMQRGQIAEMQTGEGKTLAAVPAILWYACKGRGMHVLTANDYLARRDATWMQGIYQYFGLSVASISQNSSAEARRAAYAADVTYTTAHEVGFDHLRDGLARRPDELVQRSFAFALIDEADSALIDEARNPLIIAGGVGDPSQLAFRADEVARQLLFGKHYRLDEFGRNAQLTDNGIQHVERAFRCENLYEECSLYILTAGLDALHAHALLKRDVDYVVKNGSIESIDEFKGRIAETGGGQLGFSQRSRQKNVYR